MTNPTKSAMDVWREAWSAAGWRSCKDHHQAAATVIDQALQAAREEERAAVVAWLSDYDPHLADAIERGEHRREG